MPGLHPVSLGETNPGPAFKPETLVLYTCHSQKTLTVTSHLLFKLVRVGRFAPWDPLNTSTLENETSVHISPARPNATEQFLGFA